MLGGHRTLPTDRGPLQIASRERDDPFRTMSTRVDESRRGDPRAIANPVIRHRSGVRVRRLFVSADSVGVDAPIGDRTQLVHTRKPYRYDGGVEPRRLVNLYKRTFAS